MFGVDIQLIMTSTKTFAETMLVNLTPTVKSMFVTLCTLDLVLSMLYDESDGLNIFIKFFKKIFYYLFFWWIILNFKDLTFETLFKGFVQLGNVAGGGITSTDLDWTVINKIGMSTSKLAGAVLTGGTLVALDIAWIESVPIVGIMAICSFIMFFVFLYIQVVTVFIKFYFMAGFSYVLIPFAGFNKTKDIASKAINGLFAQGLEIFIMVVMLRFLEYLDGKGVLTMSDDLKASFFTRWVLVFLMYMLLTRTTTIASSLMSGTIASLGIGASAMGSAGSGVTGSAGRWAGGQIQSKKLHDSFNPKAQAMKSGISSAYRKACNFGKTGLNNSEK